MELVCPEINDLVTCFTCSEQAFPPYRMCLDSHVACSTCPKYLQRCACGESFALGRLTTYDCLIGAMKLKCKYTMAAKVDDDRCPDKWYTIDELTDHYRSECTMNTFVCQLNGCGHVCRVETVIEHYESTHGPFESIAPTNPAYPNTVSFCILANVGVICKRIFNGYFLFSVESPMPHRYQNTRVSMRNVNPTDRMRYTCTTFLQCFEGEMICKVSVTLNERHK